MKTTQQIETLVQQSSFGSPDERMKAQTEIKNTALSQGIRSASIHELYMAFGRGEVSGFSVPACNLRTLTYDTARVIFQLLKQINAQAFIFEIARGELTYTDQTASEYTASILAAALVEGWRGPVFIQADHTQFNAVKFNESRDAAIINLKAAIKTAVDAGFYNIDIDASTLVDLKAPTLDEQQKNNYEMTALLTSYIRSIQPQGITVSVGGEIGHIGGKNSTVDEFKAFMEGYNREYKSQSAHMKSTPVGLSKVSVQTGTSHGGTVMADGKLKKVILDFSVLSSIGAVARDESHIGGPVQHGASTLPNELFDQFPRTGTIEVHLATGFQNIVMDNLPESLKQEIQKWVLQNCEGDRKPDWNDAQLVYKFRKKANKPFKKQIWVLEQSKKQEILSLLRREFEIIFEKLNIKNTAAVVERYIT